MPAKPTFTQDELRAMLARNWSAASIARRTGVHRSTVTRAIAKLKADDAAESVGNEPEESTPKQSFEERIKADIAAGLAQVEDDYGDISVFDTRAAAERNYRRALKLLDDAIDPLDVNRGLASVQRALNFAMKIKEREAGIEAVRAFLGAVLSELNECDPELRARVIDRLKDRIDVAALGVSGRGDNAAVATASGGEDQSVDASAESPGRAADGVS